MKSHHYDDARIWSHSAYEAGHEVERLKQTTKLIPPICKKILDVGCGNGVFLRMLEGNNPSLSLLGLERSSIAIKNKACRADVIQWDSDIFPFEDNTFDCVVSMALFEHVPRTELIGIIGEMCRVAREFIILDVPLNEIRVRVRCPECNCGFDPHLHLRSYKLAELTKIFPAFDKVQHVVMQGKEPFHSWCIRKLGLEMSAEYGGVKTCPQCGWTTEIEDNACKSQSPEKRQKWRNIIKALLPDITITREVAVLYRKRAE